MNSNLPQELHEADIAVQKLRLQIGILDNEIAAWEARIYALLVQAQQTFAIKARVRLLDRQANAQKKLLELEELREYDQEQLAKQTIILATLRIKNKNPI